MPSGESEAGRRPREDPRQGLRCLPAGSVGLVEWRTSLPDGDEGRSQPNYPNGRKTTQWSCRGRGSGNPLAILSGMVWIDGLRIGCEAVGGPGRKGGHGRSRSSGGSQPPLEAGSGSRQPDPRRGGRRPLSARGRWGDRGAHQQVGAGYLSAVPLPPALVMPVFRGHGRGTVLRQRASGNPRP